jgi:hypothetical protein
MSHFLDSVSELKTGNTDLAASLCACGIPLRRVTPIQRFVGDHGERYIFFFEHASPCGLYKTRELMLAWDDPAWHEKHPEHPFAYLKVAFENKMRLLDYIKAKVPIACVEQRGKTAFISVNATDDLQKRVFDRLKR